MNNNRTKKNISYFSYPKDSTRRQKWLKAVGREDLLLKLVDDKTRQQYRICEEHFEKSFINFSKNGIVKYFLNDAFPTLNLSAEDGACSTSSQSATTMAASFDDSTPDVDDKKITDMVLSMLHKCELEKESQYLKVGIGDYEGRVSYYTGISRKTLEALQKNKMTPKPVEYNTHITILQCLLTFYKNKNLPSYRLLFKNVNELILSMQDYEQFKQDISGIGIGYKKIFNKTVLMMEEPKITFERYSYLKRMKHVRQRGAKIYYISERVMDRCREFNNPWKNNEFSEISDKFVFFHAVSKSGLLNGLFCFAPTDHEFCKWLGDILLLQLPHSSVIVLDNSPLHGTSKFNMFSMYNTKADMLAWLRKHNVPCSAALNKSELFELIKRHPAMEESCQVDRLIEAHGHEVLRLPTHFEELSPVEAIWQKVRESVISPPLHESILKILTDMPPENYEAYVKEAEDKENEMFALDTEMDRVLDEFMMELKEREGVR